MSVMKGVVFMVREGDKVCDLDPGRYRIIAEEQGEFRLHCEFRHRVVVDEDGTESYQFYEDEYSWFVSRKALERLVEPELKAMKQLAKMRGKAQLGLAEQHFDKSAALLQALKDREERLSLEDFNDAQEIIDNL